LYKFMSFLIFNLGFAAGPSTAILLLS